MDKISSAQFHELFEGIVSPGELIGFGEQTGKAFRQGWSDAMNRVYERMVDPALDADDESDDGLSHRHYPQAEHGDYEAVDQ